MNGSRPHEPLPGHRPRPAALQAGALAAVCLLASCVSYNQRAEAALRDFEAGRFDAARQRFSDPKSIPSEFLRGAESGMVALSSGQWDAAQQDLDAAAAASKEIEERALLGPKELGESLLSFVVNEAAASYQGEGFERVQLHAALAMTYLARGSLDGVYVEARRANKLLESEEKLYEKQYQAGGLGHFISATSYELQRRFDEAYIDYDRMLAKGVGQEIAGRAAVRIAARLHYDDVLPDLIERHGEPVEIPPDAASIVVLAGVGLGPFKVEQTVAFPIPAGLVQLSVPVFMTRPQVVSALDLVVDDGNALRTSVIENVGTVSRENLNDRMAWLAFRTAARAAIKTTATHALTEGLRDSHGDGAAALGWIAGSAFTAATEHADTRAWLTLPDTWQAARLYVAPGEHDVELRAVGGEALRLGRYQLDPAETMILLVRTLGGRIYAHPIGGLRRDVPDPVPTTTPTPSPSAEI